MAARRWIGLVLSLLTMPVLVLGLIDPLEGGIAMLIAGVMVLTTWLVSRVPVPRLEWTAWLAAFTTGAIALAGAILLWESEGAAGIADGMPWWIAVPLISYEVAVAATIAGGVWYVVRHVKAVRHHGIPVAGPIAH